MINNKKYYFISVFLFFLILFFIQKSFAKENINFLSLKNSEVNLRQGPSFEYPIKLIYKKNHKIKATIASIIIKIRTPLK